jgi:flagellar biosynthesis regulator FlbT
MAFKLTLTPDKKLIIGGAGETNGNAACEFIVENNVPILMEKDIIREDYATSPLQQDLFRCINSCISTKRTFRSTTTPIGSSLERHSKRTKHARTDRPD